MATGSVSIGRGPDGTNTRVNAQGTAIPFGAPAKAVKYNPGTAAQRLAIRMMQERARQRVRAGGQAQNGFTYQQNMAEWEAAQREANAHLETARRLRANAATSRRRNALTDEFDMDEFLPSFLRADRTPTALTKDSSNWDPYANVRGATGIDIVLGEEDKRSPFPAPTIAGDAASNAELWPNMTAGSDAPGSPQPAAGLILGSDAPGERPQDRLDPTLEKYKQLRGTWLDAASKGETDVQTGADGDFGTSGGSSTSLTMGVSEGTGFPFLLVGSEGNKTIEKAPKLYTKMIAEALADPLKAGELMASLVAVGAYPGAGEKYVQDRLYLAKDKNGQPTLKGRFTQEDADALRTAMSMISADQANIADSVIARGGNIAEIPGFEELLAQRGLERQDMAGSSEPAGSSSGGGGGGGYRRGGYGGGGYGGGGGGGGGAARLTDVETLKSTVDSVARQRMGRVLTVEEAQQFANWYHDLERQSYASYLAGGGGVMLDAESRAAAWIESRFREEGARQAQGQYVAKLFQMLQSSAFLGGGE